MDIIARIIAALTEGGITVPLADGTQARPRNSAIIISPVRTEYAVRGVSTVWAVWEVSLAASEIRSDSGYPSITALHNDVARVIRAMPEYSRESITTGWGEREFTMLAEFRIEEPA